MSHDYIRYGKYLRLDYLSESFYAKAYKSKFFGTDNFYKIFTFDEISESISEDPIIFNNFMKVVKNNSKLNHSNIIKIIDFHNFHDTYALISEYFSGDPLLGLMASYFKRKKKIPLVVAVFIVTQVCDAVGYAHSLNITHGNINPLNIFITHEGLVKVKDFSFFSNLSTNTNVKALNFKQFRYIAPENFTENTILPQSDVYSLAVILYEMLTGKTIYSSKEMGSLIDKIKEGKFAPISKLNPDVPEELANIVERALSLDPSKRFDDPIQFKYAIQKFLIQGNKIFSSQHFYSLISKVFASSISKEIEENSGYKDLKLEAFRNELAPQIKPENDDDFIPEIEDELFENDDEATSILFDNIDDIESVDDIKSLQTKDSFAPSPSDDLFDDDEKTSILDDDEEIASFDSQMYEEDEKTNILDEDEDDMVEEPTPAPRKRRKGRSKTREQEEEEIAKMLHNESSFDVKSFILGAIVGLAIGLTLAFLK